MSFIDRLNIAIDKKNSLLCIGLDPVRQQLPSIFQLKEQPLFEFSKYIIDLTQEFAVAFKPNSAFFEAFGSSGIQQLQQTCEYIKERFPDTLVILDAKRGDIGSSNAGYISYAFDYLHADAITLHPYLGKESIDDFLNMKDIGVIIQCRNTNPGAIEIQGLPVQYNNTVMPLYQVIAHKAAHEWNANNNVLLVVGATSPQEVGIIRQITGDMTFLVPGVGAQGGELEETVKSGLNSQKKGLIINAGRSIIYAQNPVAEAMKLRDAINSLRM